jgi:hypothetical protein
MLDEGNGEIRAPAGRIFAGLVVRKKSGWARISVVIGKGTGCEATEYNWRGRMSFCEEGWSNHES